MATANKVFVREDYFYCSICLEIFNTPRTLPCLHTFCHSCLVGYIQKILDKPGKQKLFCPVCRAGTKTDILQFKHVEKWVENLPINFTLLSILNERNSTMNLKENNCDPCLREEIEAKAIVYCYDCTEKMCEECKRHHRKSKLSSNHKLIDVKDGCVEKMDLSELEYFFNLSKCPKHGSEDVKYLCKDHDQLCCSECAIVTHRKCEDLVSLADEVKGNEEGNNGESDIQKRLGVVGDYTGKLIEHETKFISDLNTKETEVKSCLKDFKANLDNAYNKLEKRILSEMSTRKSALTKASSLQKESAERLKDNIRQSAEKLKKASKLGTARHIFLLKREMGKDIEVYEKTCTGLQQQSSTTLLTIAEASPLQEAVKAVHNFFKVEKTMTESLPPFMMRGRDFNDRKITLMKTFDLQMNKQPRYCLWIENSIVVAFFSSTTIIAYNSENGSILSSFGCSSPPTDLATLENGEFAVALPTSNKIDILKIHKNQMSYVRLLVNSKLELTAYSRRNKQLLAMSRSDRMIRKFTLEGRNAGEIKFSGISSNDIGSAYNIYFDDEYNRIYISSHMGSGPLHCVDESGKSEFQYKIQCPWSVITDIEGNVYVASYSNHCIQQLNREGQLLKEIVSADSVQYPMAMSFNNQMNKMVITCDSSNKKMQIYQFE
ncbi:uncharacterized protein LOC128549628 [Mercenaria mercenaria]|uniref:uncharacterized protein LOC128549628 n=1 Tax=Mercenaria mercenaria TaxID=6596 RepID=UPI00234FB332|nr:uncharacterized protein LOC128549628 [Mercenaria mercenaria]